VKKEKEYHQKLIRDNIPEIIEANNGESETRTLSEIDFEKELRKKLIEEAIEVANAPSDKLLDELADMLELIKSIASNYKIDYLDIEKRQIEKRRERGTFAKRLFLIWSTRKPSK